MTERGRTRLRRWAGIATAAALTVCTIVATPAVAAPPRHPAAGRTSPGRAAQAPRVTPGKNGAVRQVCAGATHKGQMSCFALARTDVQGHKGLLAPQTLPAGLTPADLTEAYRLPSATAGSGQVVAVIDAYDDPNAEADLAVYRAQFGLPACTTANGCFRKVNQNGQSAPLPNPDASWAGETSLDVEVVSAVCPNCQILLVEGVSAQGSDLFAAVNTAADMGAKFITNSYGGPESADETGYDTLFNHPGVAITVAAGDSGYGVTYPSASPYVTSVGGTTLSRNSSDRGWNELAWASGGSGCSQYEPKPSFQTDTACPRRSTADVAAVADPQTGVASYNSYQSTGWGVYGGTSVGAPLVAAGYALAGAPAPGSAATAYPYAPGADGLNDVVAGTNGTCGSYLCIAGPGYDGPTGMGTPRGIHSLRAPGPYGDVNGTVTDSSTGEALPGARVKTGNSTAVTDSAGHYDLGLPVGSYTLSVAAYGYGSKDVGPVSIADGATATQDAVLAAVPKVTVSGTVTDGSGHGWPLYAKITLAGVPGAPLFTDPRTGRYTVSLPSGSPYTMSVDALYPGYQTARDTITVGTTDLAHDVSIKVDGGGCAAPGYAASYSGLTQSFDTSTTPPGWSVVNHNDDGGWVFNDAGGRGNLTGGDGGFAIIDSDNLGLNKAQDSELRTPVIDLTGEKNPVIGYDGDYRSFTNSTANVDLSLDSGSTWTTVLHQTDSARGPGLTEIPIPQAAGRKGVMVRFHYTGSFAWWWELDNVYVGRRSCDAVPGGLVVGRVTDKNTGAGINGATVVSVHHDADRATSAGTPDNPGVGDGFYWLFSTMTGAHPFGASRPGYQTVTTTVTVNPGAVADADFALPAGRLAVSAGTLAGSGRMGEQTTGKLTLTNTGSAPVSVGIGERDAGMTLLARQGSGAAVQRISGTYTTGPLVAGPHADPANRPAAVPAAAPWSDLANYPTPIMDNAVGYDAGMLYSVGGTDGVTVLATGSAYDPTAGTWSAIAPMAHVREKPTGAFMNGKFYVVGGWGADGTPIAATEIYDPGTNTWSAAADSPVPLAGSSSAVLDGKLYVVGGCDASQCGHKETLVYDPDSDSWTKKAGYPGPIAWQSCGAVAGALLCAGGNTGAVSTKAAWSYSPGTDSWSPLPDMPLDLWGSAVTAANGLLLISGGVSGVSTVTNQGFAYDPSTRAWTAIANSNNAVYRGGSACGFYKIGGSTGNFSAVAAVEVLPGFGQCGAPADVPWLSESATNVTLAPGGTATLTVTMNAGAKVVTQPGAYTAQLVYGTDSPYPVTATAVTMTVTPPRSWGKITGTVTGLACDGTSAPLAGATVQVNSWAAHHTLITGKDGSYALWLDRRNNPLTVIVAKDGWQPQTRVLRVGATSTTTADWQLGKAPACP